MSQNLVQISDLKFKNAYWSPEKSLAVINAPKNPLMLELTEALSTMFGRIGMHAVCAACFDGRLGREKGMGCCGPCSMQGRSKCLAKPLGCASFMCNLTVRLWPKVYKRLSFAMSKLSDAGVPGGYHEGGVNWANRFVPSETQEALLRWAIWYINRTDVYVPA
jgi:hypothetical protein